MKLEITCTLNSGSIDVTLYHDSTGDGNSDESETLSLSDGTNVYDFSTITVNTGDDYWVGVDVTANSTTSTPTVSSIKNAGITLSVADVKENSVDISWDNPNNVSQFDVYRSTSSGSSASDYTKIEDAETNTSYTDSNVTTGTTYYYRVADDGSSELSNEVSATPQIPLKWNIASEWDNYQSQSSVVHEPTPAGVGADTVGVGYDTSTLPQQSNVVAYWPLTDSSGAEDVVNSNNMSTVSGATAQGGSNLVSRPTYDFESADYLEYSADGTFDITGDLTISCWINLDNLSDHNKHTMLARRDASGTETTFSFRAEVIDDQLSYFHWDGSSNIGITRSFTWSTGTWYHCVIVRDSSVGDLELYVDGTSLGTTSYSSSPASNTLNTRMGVRAEDDTTEDMNGSVAHMMVWDTALTSSEVSTLYGIQSGGSIITGRKTG